MDKELMKMIQTEDDLIVRNILLSLLQNNTKLQEEVKMMYYKHR